MSLPDVIGIAGTNGSGKDTLADLRLARTGARKVSLSDILRVEASRRGQDHSHESLRGISTELSQRFGAGALVIIAIEEYFESPTAEENGLSVVSLRRVDEAREVKDRGGVVLWVDADRETRYRRIQAASRGREDDQDSYERFCEQEDIELYPTSCDPNVLNMNAVREEADIHIDNSFATAEAYADFLVRRFRL